MKQFKRAKVIMLPTENESLITLDNKELFLNNIPKFNENPFGYKNQHLYIISDEDLLSNDYGINTLTNTIIQNGKAAVTLNDWKYIKRIIATTDTSLKLKEININDQDSTSTPYLPQPSQEFITKFIEEYNKGNVIENVLVKLYPTNEFLNDVTTNSSHYKLSINKDNTINIQLPKITSLNLCQCKIFNVSFQFPKD